MSKNDQKPSAPVQPARQSWEDNAADIMPKRAQYFDNMRTHAFQSANVVQQFVEFWGAFQVDAAQDKWRVMHYMLNDLDQKTGDFQSEDVLKKDVSFSEAVYQLAQFEHVSSRLAKDVQYDMEAKYAPKDHVVLQKYYYDLPHYKTVGNIEGFAFDQDNAPYRRAQGRIIGSAVFERAEVERSILAAERIDDNENLKNKVEGGILADIFSSVAGRTATLDGLLKASQSLAIMDLFATRVGSFYLAVQKVVGLDQKFDKVEGLTPAEREDSYSRSKELLRDNDLHRPRTEDLPMMMERLGAIQNLQSAKQIGVHTEPFEKFAAECALYAHLIHAAHNLNKLEKGLKSVNNTDVNLINQVRESVDNAQEKFYQLGGTPEQVDKLKSWVATYAKMPEDAEAQQALREKMLPASLPGFLTRYYKSRANVMKKMQEGNVNARQVNVMPAEVKPPITDQYTDPLANKPVNDDNTSGGVDEKLRRLGTAEPKKPGR